MIKSIHIEANTIPDAWFQCIYNLMHTRPNEYINERGSFEGEKRIEFDWVSIHILYPYGEPYDSMLPQIPDSFGIPNPVANGYIEQYLPYIMTDTIKEGEDYSYGNRIDRQVRKFIEVLKKTPHTNQAILQVAKPLDYTLKDPPCLRHIDMRIKDGILYFYPYFRSWDLWGGFPANLAAIAVLQHHMAEEIGVLSGAILASSKGLHIYGYVEELAKMRIMMKNSCDI